MPIIEKSTTINAPVEQIFAYVDNPANLPEYWASMVEVKDIQPSALGGNNFRWVYKMMGLRFDGASEVLEHIDKKRIMVRNSGGITGTITFSFEPDGPATRVTFKSDYTIPGGQLGKLAEPLVTKQNEREAENLLATMKDKMEL